MNTNFNKTIKRGFLLFLSLSCLVFADIKIDKNLAAKQELFLPLVLKENSYIKGTYKLKSIVDKIELLDKNKKFLRRLDKQKKLSSPFIFLTKNDSKFYIKVENQKEKNHIEFNIENPLEVKYSNTSKIEILSPTIKKISKELETNKDTSTFWKKIEKIGTPLIEPLKNDKYLVTFLYRGAKHNVKLLGAPVAEHVLLNRLKNSDIWYKSFQVKKGIKMSYQVAPDVPSIKGTKWEKRIAILATAQADPLNKNPYIYKGVQTLDKYAMYSTFEILNEDYVDWTVEKTKEKGKIIDTKIKSKILNDERIISIYTPFNFDYKKPHKLLFVFDGIEYQTKVPTPTILDNLIAKNKILPTIAVFIDNPSRKVRSSQLPPNKNFAKFMAKELVPFVKEKIKIDVDAKNTILTGSSYGGLASMYVAFSYPEIFGNVLSQSGSFWWGEEKDEEPEWLTRQIAKAPKKDLKIYLNAGVYETGYFPIDILESNRHLRTVLKAKGYEHVIYKELQNSHDYFAWRSNLALGLISLNKE